MVEHASRLPADLEEADRLAYFDAVYTGYSRAVEQIGDVVERFYSIGGFTIRLRFAGDGLVSKLTRALAHLAIPATDSQALTICVWDSASTKTPLPLLVGSLVDLLKQKWWELLGIRREIKRYDGQRIRTSFFLGPDILSVLDTQNNIGVYWIDDAERIPYWEHGSPFLSILSWWMELKNRQYVHAGAIGNHHGGILLAGKGGSGKSTTALTCLSTNFAYVSDDYSLLTETPMPYVYSLYNTAKLKGPHDLDRLPFLRDKITNVDRLPEEKAVIFLHEHYPEQIVGGFPVRAVVVPRVTGQAETRVRPLSPVQALKALAPSSLFQVPGSGQNKFRMLARLVKQVPCFELELGANIATIPPVIGQLLSEHAN
jgi:hypothetical protein